MPVTISATDDLGVTGYILSESGSTPVLNQNGWVNVPRTRNFITTTNYSFSLSDGTKPICLV